MHPLFTAYMTLKKLDRDYLLWYDSRREYYRRYDEAMAWVHELHHHLY